MSKFTLFIVSGKNQPCRTSTRSHEVTKCASKKSVFFSKIENRYFCLFFCANLTVLGVLVGSAGE
jgi:hypothetical protein